MSLKEISEFVGEACRRKGLSWRAASLGAGLNPTAVYSIVRRVSMPSPETCRRLAAFFGVSEEYLLEMAEHLTPRSEEIDIARALKSKYRHLPPEAVQEILDFIQWMVEKYQPKAKPAGDQ